jgi:5-oxoprolinase (ATP-hydrolysing)
MKFIQENAELAVRDMIKNLCRGQLQKTLRGSDSMDDGTDIKLTVTMNGDTGEAVFDFSGTGPEVLGNLNAPEAVTFSAIIYCLRVMIGHEVPLNQGCLSPVTVIIPSRCLLSPSPSSAVVGGNVETSQRVVDVILQTFDACACSQGTMNNVTFGDDTQGYYETVAGGAGAGHDWHGSHAVHTHMTNTRMTDAEIIEQRYPVVVKEFTIRKGSGGRGRFRGGDGVIRQLLFRTDMVLSVLSERRSLPPCGVRGGQPGKRGKNILSFANGRMVNLGSKASVRVSAGDIFRLETPGGGGYGSVE